MRIRWLPEAWEDIQRLFAFLVEKDPIAAGRAIESIRSGSDRLLDMPEIGRPIHDNGQRRELYLSFGHSSYVLRYRLDGDCVVIIRVWHSREQRE